MLDFLPTMESTSSLANNNFRFGSSSVIISTISGNLNTASDESDYVLEQRIGFVNLSNTSDICSDVSNCSSIDQDDDTDINNDKSKFNKQFATSINTPLNTPMSTPAKVTKEQTQKISLPSPCDVLSLVSNNPTHSSTTTPPPTPPTTTTTTSTKCTQTLTKIIKSPSNHSYDQRESQSETTSGFPYSRNLEKWKWVSRAVRRLGKGLMHPGALPLYSEHWLEAIDKYHRCGSNLKFYHQFWLSCQNTSINFFTWLDHGDGLHVDLASCPRINLKKHCVMYCTESERKKYEVKIVNGILRYIDGDYLVHTPQERINYNKNYLAIRNSDYDNDDFKIDNNNYKSSNHNKISQQPTTNTNSIDSISSIDRVDSNNNGESDILLTSFQDLDFLKEVSSSSSIASISSTNFDINNHLIDNNKKQQNRSSSSSTKYIFVLSSDKKLFIARKQRGYFHHSSFLSGGAVLSAGRMNVCNGCLVSIAPHSGHYRTSPHQFSILLNHLSEQGVDLNAVHIDWLKNKPSKQMKTWSSSTKKLDLISTQPMECN
eukprot:Awhi_evm1s8982